MLISYSNASIFNIVNYDPTHRVTLTFSFFTFKICRYFKHFNFLIRFKPMTFGHLIQWTRSEGELQVSPQTERGKHNVSLGDTHTSKSLLSITESKAVGQRDNSLFTTEITSKEMTNLSPRRDSVTFYK